MPGVPTEKVLEKMVFSFANDVDEGGPHDKENFSDNDEDDDNDKDDDNVGDNDGPILILGVRRRLGPSATTTTTTTTMRTTRTTRLKSTTDLKGLGAGAGV